MTWHPAAASRLCTPSTSRPPMPCRRAALSTTSRSMNPVRRSPPAGPAEPKQAPSSLVPDAATKPTYGPLARMAGNAPASRSKVSSRSHNPATPARSPAADSRTSTGRPALSVMPLLALRRSHLVPPGEALGCDAELVTFRILHHSPMMRSSRHLLIADDRGAKSHQVVDG